MARVCFWGCIALCLVNVVVYAGTDDSITRVTIILCNAGLGWIVGSAGYSLWGRDR